MDDISTETPAASEVASEGAPGPSPSVRTVEGIFDRPVLPMLVKLGAPIFAGMFVQFLYNLTDTFFISLIDRSDPSYVGGTGIIFPIVFFAIALSNGIQVGVSSLVARAIGQRNRAVLGRIVESGLAIGLSVAVVIVTGGYLLSGSLIRLLGATGDYYTHALEYLRYVLPSIGLSFIGSVFIGVLQGEGRMHHAMVAMFVGTAANIALDPLFIFALGMDVRGAAIATVISQALSVSYIVSVFVRHKSSVEVEWRLDNVHADTMGKIVAIGLPQAVTQIVMSMSFVVFNRVVVTLDPLALTAFTLNGRVEQIIFMPIFAVGSAMITLTGQNAGRGLYARVQEVWRTGILFSMAVVLVIAATLFAAAPLVYPIFTDLGEVLHYSVTQTRLMAFTFLFAVLGIQARSVFLAIGRPLPAMVLTLLRLIGIALPAVTLMVYAFHLGMYGVWFGLMAGNVISGIAAYLWTTRSLALLQAGRLTVART